MKRLTFCRLLAVLLILSLGLAQPLLAADGEGLFSRLKAKAAQKMAQLKDKNWWTVTMGGKAAAFVGGKVIGLAGAALGGALGLMAGPAGAAVGALVGYRLGGIAGSTFSRPIGKDLARDKLAGDDDLSWSDVKESWKNQDKKALAVEAGAGIIGDFLGEVFGVTMGIALLGGMGPIALPILGVVTGAYLGKKVGRWLGRSVGKYLSTKVAKKGYTALTGKEPAAWAPTESIPTSGTSSSSSAAAPSSTLKNPALSASIGTAQLQTAYEAAYQRYAQAQGDSRASEDERQRLLQEYRAAFEAWRTSLLAAPANR